MLEGKEEIYKPPDFKIHVQTLKFSQLHLTKDHFIFIQEKKWVKRIQYLCIYTT